MISTYKNLFAFILILCPLLLGAQNLEDKVAEARKLQAQGLTNVDASQIDSLVAQRQLQEEKKGKITNKKQIEKAVTDSLIAGPKGSRNSKKMRTKRDSTFTKNKGKGDLNDSLDDEEIEMSKRYEQRIFANSPGSLFGSYGKAVGKDYVLGPGDEILVALWGDKEKEYSLTLNEQGSVFLEGVGLVSLRGNNITEAEKKLKEHLSKIYSGINRGTAHVDVSLGKGGPIKVFVLGEVKLPGGYVFSGNTSIMSAMYFAQGPSDIGTVRNLQLTRSGKKYSLDLYKYLIRGESLTPDVLQDGDILFSARADALVEITGDVGRPATYELKKGEGIKELLEFAGRLNSTAANQKMTLKRIFPNGRMDFIDLPSPQDILSGKEKIELQDGDEVLVEKSTEPSRDFVTVSGPVKYPGTYGLLGLKNVNDLVAKAGGLQEDAFLGRVHVVRIKPNGSSELFAYNLDSTQVTDTISIQPRDNVILYSIKDMYLPDSVEIAGAVFNPGKYEYSRGMSVKDLIMRSGGFLPHHERGKILIARSEVHEQRVSNVLLDVEDGLGKSGENFLLNPDDFVQIPIDPRYYKKEIVDLEGLFVHPGKYSLQTPGESLASVIARAGGFREGAYVEGGRLYRKKNKVGRIGLEIKDAVKNSSSKMNIPLVGEDSIYIPERLNTVKVVGEVGFETSVLFESGANAEYYIEKAGGFTRRSEKDKIVIEYANGETSRDGTFNRKPDAGTVIYVPQGPEPKPIDWLTGTQAILALVTTLLTIVVISNQLK